MIKEKKAGAVNSFGSGGQNRHVPDIGNRIYYTLSGLEDSSKSDAFPLRSNLPRAHRTPDHPFPFNGKIFQCPTGIT